jgi:hypothetical protein
MTMRVHPLHLMAGALALAGCANVAPPATAVPAGVAPGAIAAAAAAVTASAAAAGRPPTAVAVVPVPGQPQPFATVIKDARRIDGGLFTVWHKDDKFWFELAPQDFDKPFVFGPKIAQGIGENGLYGGSMMGRWGSFGRQQTVQFRRLHNQVQLLALNTAFDAPANTPEGRAVRAAFSPSLVGSSAVASQPHPDRKSVLVEANPIFLSDLLGMAINLQRSYRQNYAFDRANSAITAVRGKPGELVFEVQAHYASAGLAVPQPGSPAPAAAQPTQPRSLPDARSLFFGLHYAFAALPAQALRPRPADARVGHFTTNVASFADDLARTPQQRYVNRWRLEKQDPAAALSEPVKPITFWLDRTVPLKYREAITRGVLGWNAAFEKIGFKNALVVKVQPDDADFDTLDMGVASIRWMTNSQPSFGAIGPSQVDPRTGEILDADIGFESLSSRNLRAYRSQILAAAPAGGWALLMQLPDAMPVTVGGDAAANAGDFAPRFRLDGMACGYADFAAEQLAYALDVLEARGELDPDSPEAEQFVLDYLTDTTLHEVGHTLGLRHNFRSSRIYTRAQMNDPEFVRSHGLAGSVMEYAPINLAEPGARPVPGFQSVLGPYDYWAIEYAYKPMPPGTTPAQEAAELQRIAARSAEPLLAYGTDEDNGLGIDPDSLIFDLGDDAVGFARQRLDIARDLIQRQSTRELKPSADYSVLRRSVGYALREMARAGGVLARQIGGVRTLRDFPGSGRDPLQPVEAASQRAALEQISRHFMSADAVVVPAALQRRLAPDFNERTDAVFAGENAAVTDYSPATQLLEMQRTLLAQLMSDGVAQRLLDSESRVAQPEQAFHLSELYERLGRDLWSELDAKAGDIPAPRRELQRDHATRIAASLTRPAGQGRADARALLRAQAQGLLARLDAAQRRPALSAEARAHLADVAEQLRQALQARITRPV